MKRRRYTNDSVISYSLGYISAYSFPQLSIARLPRKNTKEEHTKMHPQNGGQNPNNLL